MPADFRRPETTSAPIAAPFIIELSRSDLGVNPNPKKYKFSNYTKFNTLIRFLGMLSNNISIKYIFPEYTYNPIMKNNEIRNVAKNLLNNKNYLICEVSYKANNFVVLVYREKSGIGSNRSYGR